MNIKRTNQFFFKPFLIVLVLILVFNHMLQSQSSYLDSLENQLKIKSIHDTSKIKLLNELSYEYYRSDPDLTLKYAKQSLQLIESLKKKKFKWKNNGIDYKQSEAFNSMGIYYWVTSDLDSAMYWYVKSLVTSKMLNDKGGISSAYGNIASLYSDLGNLDSALHYNLLSLRIKEEQKNYKGIAHSYNNCGFIMWEMNKRKEALEYFYKSLHIRQQIKDSIGEAACWNNIGNYYLYQEIPDSAKIFHKTAMNIRLKVNDLFGLAESYNNIGLICERTGDLDSAAFYYKKALELNEESGNLNLAASNYNNIGNVYYKSKQYSLAKQNILKSLELSQKTRVKTLMKESYEILFTIFYDEGNYKKALDYFMAYSKTSDTIMNENMTNQLLEINTKYETEKKENQIIILDKENQLSKLEIEKQKAENEKQRLWTYSFVIGFSIVLIFSIIILRMFSAKRKANKLLKMLNEEILQKNEEITANKDEIEAQRDLVVQQRDLIMEQKQDITDSIEYAYKIQSAAFPSPDEISVFLKDYFILYKPRNIVSGDFYWVNRLDNKIIIIAADCTGHGVPGAFMSMLGIAFLNEIVNKEQISSPSKILDRLRENIILALKQHGAKSGQKDGMDVAAITIDFEKQTLEFSGANNPLYVVKNEILIETKGDKMPVSVHPRMNPFSNKIISLLPNDCIYIFSDGYADQFGGPEGKKFKYQPFKELLVSLKEKTMIEQKEILNTTFENWKGDFDQIDDVLIIGIKI